MVKTINPVCPFCGENVKNCGCDQKPRCRVHNAFLEKVGRVYKCPISGCSYAENSLGYPVPNWWKK